MGKKARERRKQEKAAFNKIPPHWRENEFGELIRHATKAEARQTLLRRELRRAQLERQIMDLMVTRVRDDMQAEEDRHAFGV